MAESGKVTSLGRRIALFGTSIALLGTVAIGGTALASSGHVARPASVPKLDIVGKGTFNCATVTGEVGYSPAIISGGKTKERVSIWFVASGCKPSSTTGAKPIPKTVVGSISFLDNFLNGCPQLSGPPLGTGILNLAYNFPQVPVTMIDPSVAPTAVVTDVGALWKIVGGVTDGSYVSPGFSALIKPNPIAPQSCGRGITSEYIIRGTLTNV
jgi:hypothetical protein